MSGISCVQLFNYLHIPLAKHQLEHHCSTPSFRLLCSEVERFGVRHQCSTSIFALLHHFCVMKLCVCVLGYRVPEECPAEVQELVVRCMAADPSTRPSAKQIHEALLAVPYPVMPAVTPGAPCGALPPIIPIDTAARHVV